MKQVKILKVVGTFYGDTQTITFTDGEVIVFNPNTDWGRALTKGMIQTAWLTFEGDKQAFKGALERNL